jgi:hypothetical protein
VKSRLGGERGMVPSGSDDSLKGFMSGGNDTGLGDRDVEEEVLGESEAVLVTVRYVRLSEEKKERVDMIGSDLLIPLRRIRGVKAQCGKRPSITHRL